MGRRRKKIVENLTVHGIADKGMAVARDEEGMVYFVKDAVPGDVIDLLVLRKKKGFKTGIVEKFRSMSPHRVEAFCKHFELCGGCKWQHLSYENQLKFKQENVVSAISRIGKIDSTLVQPIIGSTTIKYYRNKLEYSFSQKRWLTKAEIDSDQTDLQKPALGFHAPGSFDKVIDIDECHLQDIFSDEIRNWTRNYAIEQNLSYFNIKENHGFFRNLMIRNTTLGEWMVNIIVGEDSQEKIINYCTQLSTEFPQITSIFYTINTKQNDSIYDLKVESFKGPGYIKEQLGELVFQIGPKSFFQTNSLQTAILYNKIVEFADLKGSENVYDLYTGTGSIALYMAKYCRRVVGIETVPEAVIDANKNKELNNIENAEFVVGDVKDILGQRFIQKHGSPDLLVTDPPRAGMHKDVIETLLNLNVPKIIYVSCNPATQARDIQLLAAKYLTEKIQPIDMFPHTSHVESIALLKLKS